MRILCTTLVVLLLLSFICCGCGQKEDPQVVLQKMVEALRALKSGEVVISYKHTETGHTYTTPDSNDEYAEPIETGTKDVVEQYDGTGALASNGDVRVALKGTDTALGPEVERIELVYSGGKTYGLKDFGTPADIKKAQYEEYTDHVTPEVVINEGLSVINEFVNGIQSVSRVKGDSGSDHLRAIPGSASLELVENSLGTEERISKTALVSSPIDIWIDPKTYLPVKLTYHGSGVTGGYDEPFSYDIELLFQNMNGDVVVRPPA